MSSFKTKDGTNIFHKDQGRGAPVVFSHGWPLSADAWDAQKAGGGRGKKAVLF